jgi:alpha-glucosidase (family GH31 glycosyl hydrolase)
MVATAKDYVFRSYPPLQFDLIDRSIPPFLFIFDIQWNLTKPDTDETKFLWKPNKFPSPEEILLQLMLI